MVSRQIKMPVKDEAEKSPEANDVFSQRKRPELGRYLLQVDRQTKGSYTTSNAAQSAALVIKTGHPIGVSVRRCRQYQHDRGGAGRAGGMMRVLVPVTSKRA